jgi:hypothetical protein
MKRKAKYRVCMAATLFKVMETNVLVKSRIIFRTKFQSITLRALNFTVVSDVCIAGLFVLLMLGD